MTESQDFVGQSRAAFDSLAAKFAGTAGNTITYVG